MPRQEEHMIRMQVSKQAATRAISHIAHKTCQQSFKKYWRTYQDGTGQEQATAQSICWLFLWATTTRKGTTKARPQARHAFDYIFDQPWDWLQAQLPQQKAGELRYQKPREKVTSIEQDFAACLKRHVPTPQ